VQQRKGSDIAFAHSSTEQNMLSFGWMKTTRRRQRRKVLKMVQIDYIKYLYESEGKSLREIAREMQLNFRTVQKYAYMDDFNSQELPYMEPENYPVLGPCIPIINEWMEQDLREPRKQRHTAARIWQRLKEEHGYPGCYTSVKRYVARRRWFLNQAREGYLPLSQPPGHAQTDFGEFKYYDSLGVGHDGYALLVTFPHSNAGWMQVFPAQNQECLLEGLKRIFYHIGGVPIRLRCDNMTTAVAQILDGAERVLSDGFYRFKLHHRFEADFCNPASGNEKGNVENKVGYDRRNLLVPVPTIDDFAAFNETYAKYFTSRPARSTFAVKQLPKNALVEIETIAELS
jgi:transposase